MRFTIAMYTAGDDALGLSREPSVLEASGLGASTPNTSSKSLTMPAALWNNLSTAPWSFLVTCLLLCSCFHSTLLAPCRVRRPTSGDILLY